jgi:uncharacterized membrane protein YccC
MTILGGFTGTLIFILIKGYLYLLFPIMMLTIFFMVYSFGYSFKSSAFFVTMFVVFLFGMIGHWDFQLLEIRIYETILGATIAVLTSLIFMPSHAKSNFKYQARNYVAQCKELIDKSFNIASHSENAIIITDLRDKLFKSLNQLSETYNTSTYEMLVTLVPRKEARQLLNNYSVLIHYVTSLLEASPFFHYQLLTEESKKQLKEVQHTLLQNISIIIYKFDQQNNEKSIESLDFKLDTLTESCLLALKTNNEVSTGTMHMISFIYYIRKINEVLLDLEKL